MIAPPKIANLLSAGQHKLKFLSWEMEMKKCVEIAHKLAPLRVLIIPKFVFFAVFLARKRAFL